MLLQPYNSLFTRKRKDTGAISAGSPICPTALRENGPCKSPEGDFKLWTDAGGNNSYSSSSYTRPSEHGYWSTTATTVAPLSQGMVKGPSHKIDFADGYPFCFMESDARWNAVKETEGDQKDNLVWAWSRHNGLSRKSVNAAFLDGHVAPLEWINAATEIAGVRARDYYCDPTK